MIEVEWANEDQTIVLWTFQIGWTWADFLMAQKSVDAMIDSVDGIVDSILVTTAQQRVPPNAITNLRNIVQKRHPRHDTIVIVGARAYLSALANTILRLVPGISIQLHFVETMEQAFDVIQAAQQRRAQASH